MLFTMIFIESKPICCRLSSWHLSAKRMPLPFSYKRLASMTPLQILCSFQTWNAAPINIKQHKALAEVVDSILNRGADPNSVAAKNTVAGSVAGAAISKAPKNNLSKNISRLHPSGVPGGALEEVFNWFNDNKFLINTKFGQTIFHMALKVIIILININALKVWSRRATITRSWCTARPAAATSSRRCSCC